MKILLIEDDKNDIEYIKEILKDNEITVLTSIPTQPIQTDYDLVIVDLFINGVITTSFLKDIHKYFKHVPSVFISSGKMDELDLREIPSTLNAMLISKDSKYKDTLHYYIDLIKTLPATKETMEYKTLFLDIVHDLRNDLGYTSYYDAFKKEGFESDKEELELLRSVQRSAKFAYSRLEHLSEFLNIESEKFGTLNDAFKLINSSNLIESHIDKISLKGDIDKVVTFIPTFFLSVLLKNFIENSCKYAKSPERLKVEIDFHKVGDFFELHIEDNSGGMPENLSKNLFQKKHSSKTGLGIGLIILNRIITSYNGTIKIESKPQIGTNIMISFPVPK